MVSFPLLNEPMDYQLTVHYNNYQQTKNPVGSFNAFILDFSYVNASMHIGYIQTTYVTMYNLINYYGHAKIEQWINTFIKSNVA